MGKKISEELRQLRVSQFQIYSTSAVENYICGKSS